MTQHTPGPWIAEQIDPDTVWINPDALAFDNRRSRTICRITIGWQGDYNYIRDEENEANARLIAAAPDLLEAASEALAYLNLQALRYCDDNEAAYKEIKKARTMLSVAISKAEGHVVCGSLQDAEIARAAIAKARGQS